jgi:enoyl-CoA hydratase/carnithine racemase
MALIRLERPDALNALTLPMIGAIKAFAEAAERDPDITAICITGSGRGFCAGIDMRILVDHAGGGVPPRAAQADTANDRPALFSFLLDISKPVIAAINGVVAGGGFVLAMMCDLRFVADDASISTIFAKRGLIAEHGMSWLLPRIIGLSRAYDLLWSSRKIAPDEALRIGLVDRVVPGDGLVAAVRAYVDDLAAHTSPQSLALIKAQLLRHLQTDFDTAAHEADAMMATVLRHPDATEGAMSFVERRPPRFAPWTGGSQ